MAKQKVCVLFGGISSEHEVSLMSATSVIRNIPTDRYEVIPVGITKKGRWLYYPGPVEHLADGSWERYPDCVPAFLSPDAVDRGLVKCENGSFSLMKIDAVFPVLRAPMSLADAMDPETARQNIAAAAEQILRLWLRARQ